MCPATELSDYNKDQTKRPYLFRSFRRFRRAYANILTSYVKFMVVPWLVTTMVVFFIFSIFHINLYICWLAFWVLLSLFSLSFFFFLFIISLEWSSIKIIYTERTVSSLVTIEGQWTAVNSKLKPKEYENHKKPKFKKV